MAVQTKAKTKAKAKAKPKVKAVAKPKAAVKKSAAKPAKKNIVKAKAVEKKISPKAAVKPVVTQNPELKKPVARKVVEPAAVKSAPVLKPALPVIKRTVVTVERRKSTFRQPSQRSTQFNFMKAPGVEHAFEVGDTVEVFCDHEKNRDRIRGWVKGIIVQVDHKLAAVQFRSNVYLTDGWMVPDRILWFPLNSEHIRPVPGAKKSAEKKDFIPDY